MGHERTNEGCTLQVHIKFLHSRIADRATHTISACILSGAPIIFSRNLSCIFSKKGVQSSRRIISSPLVGDQFLDCFLPLFLGA